MPGSTFSIRSSSVSAVMRPARRISSISAGGLYSIIELAPRGRSRGPRLGQRRHRALGDVVGQGVGVDLAKQTAVVVEREQGLRLSVVDLEPVPHRLFAVILALGEAPS